jgi:hypothetical protein
VVEVRARVEAVTRGGRGGIISGVIFASGIFISQGSEEPLI